MAEVAELELFNGERAVVFLLVSRLLFSVPPPLFLEAAALCFLSVAGLLVEIAAAGNLDALCRFRTRPGASSGILLGAVTLPTVLLSRLIQTLRILSVHDVGSEGIAYLNLQYWTVSTGCCGVLLFIILILRQTPNNITSSQLRSSKASKYSSLYIVLYVLMCCLAFAKRSYSGSYISINLLWLLFHGLATVSLIQKLLQSFPSCASMGEALLVSSGLILYFGDILAHTLSQISLSLSASSTIVHSGTQNEVSTVIQGLLLGLVLLPVLYKSVLRICLHFRILKPPAVQLVEGSMNRGIGCSVAFYSSLSVMLTLIVPAWMYFVQDFHVYPALWMPGYLLLFHLVALVMLRVLNFVFTEPLKRLALCTYWISVICASVFRFYNISKHSKTERILLRKYYHLVAVLMFTPALLFQPPFLELAFGAALAVFLVLEMIRIWKIWPFGGMIHQFMNAFTDHRDSEILISFFPPIGLCASSMDVIWVQ
ncbi:dolichol kinase EVAN [Iris pallida]|uniref:dolichol kinase n=1 Tax=Iris pallida TaxID=29817 RepID=A0AAX6HQC1_IRIPA|nr:dolichol kinase EVAN [Iris pallida]